MSAFSATVADRASIAEVLAFESQPAVESPSLIWFFGYAAPACPLPWHLFRPVAQPHPPPALPAVLLQSGQLKLRGLYSLRQHHSTGRILAPLVRCCQRTVFQRGLLDRVQIGAELPAQLQISVRSSARETSCPLSSRPGCATSGAQARRCRAGHPPSEGHPPARPHRDRRATLLG